MTEEYNNITGFEKRPFFSKRDGLLLALLLFAVTLGFFVYSLAPKGAVAVIEKNGQALGTYLLSECNEPKTLEIEGEQGIVVTVTLERDGAAITQSSCPDRTCVRTGKLVRAGESAVCLPARVSLRLQGSEADGMTY